MRLNKRNLYGPPVVRELYVRARKYSLQITYLSSCGSLHTQSEHFTAPLHPFTVSTLPLDQAIPLLPYTNLVYYFLTEYYVTHPC